MLRKKVTRNNGPKVETIGQCRDSWHFHFGLFGLGGSGVPDAISKMLISERESKLDFGFLWFLPWLRGVPVRDSAKV